MRDRLVVRKDVRRGQANAQRRVWPTVGQAEAGGQEITERSTHQNAIENHLPSAEHVVCMMCTMRLFVYVFSVSFFSPRVCFCFYGTPTPGKFESFEVSSFQKEEVPESLPAGGFALF